MIEIVYLDNNSTTAIDERVLNTMLPFLKNQFANASSSHSFGQGVKNAVDIAKTQLADLIGSKSLQLVLTSGATEAINLALKSLLAKPGNKKHIVTLETEHKAVLETCQYIEECGFEVTYLPVNKDGLLDLKAFESAIREDTLLASVMWVNNETGVIQDIEAISRICQKTDVLFMTDATQAVGKLPINVSELNIDFLTLSGHKFNAPKGVGALYFSKAVKNYLTPQIHGGGQEFGLRSGTINTAGIIGIGAAAEIAANEMLENSIKVKALRDKLEIRMLEIEGAFVNGNINNRVYNVSNICFPNLESDVLIGKLKNIAISSGSACTSEIIEPSHVLRAMGLSNEEANGSLRFSLGKYNTEAEIDFAITELKSAIQILQKVN